VNIITTKLKTPVELQANQRRVEWATIKNAFMGTNLDKVGAGTISVYCKEFAARLMEYEDTIILGPYESFDVVSDLLELQSKLHGYATDANKNLQRLAILDGEISTTIAALSDSRMVDTLVEANITLENRLNHAQIALDNARKEYTLERERRVQAEQTHGESTRR